MARDKSILFHTEQLIRAQNSAREIAILASVVKRAGEHMVGAPGADDWIAIQDELTKAQTEIQVALHFVKELVK